MIGKIRNRYRDRLACLLAVDELSRDSSRRSTTGVSSKTRWSIFTSDNGFLQGEHRFHRGKRGLWEESVRVPMLVRGAGVSKPAGGRAPETANIDLAPTILTPPGSNRRSSKIDGRPLLPWR